MFASTLSTQSKIFLFLVVIFFSLVSLDTTHTLQAQNISENVVQVIDTWLASNSGTSGEKIVEFLNAYLPQLKTIDESYYVLEEIIKFYPPQKISYTIYRFFAQVAALKFDFSTAAQMYYQSYILTKDYRDFFNSALQEYEAGNIAEAEAKTDIILESNTEDFNLRSIVIVLKSEIMLLDQNPTQVLKTLETYQYQIPTEHINSAFLYQVYRISLLADDLEVSQRILSILADYFPDSIEMSTIRNRSISPLPLPSLLFNALYADVSSRAVNNETSLKKDDFTNLGESLDSNNPTTDTDEASPYTPSASAVPPTTSRPTARTFSELPDYGYQVGAFSNLKNATNTQKYYFELWSRYKIDSPPPVLTKKQVQETLFYQLIFPLDSSDADVRERQTKILKDKGIEGFSVKKQ